ncbi:MAG: response regulator transcription factor [Candidatus Limnocylindrales bacterium]
MAPSEAGPRISVLVVEDHPAIAQGIGALLSDEPELDVMVVTDVASAIAVLESEVPRVALCDIMLGGEESGFDLLRRFGAKGHTAFVMFSAYGFPGFYARAVQGGAAGYVSKTAPVNVIIAAIRRAADGHPSPAPETLRRAGSAIARPSPRELVVLRMVAEGRTNRDVADALILSVKTVESVLRRLFDRYGVSSRTELVALARREGWLIADV